MGNLFESLKSYLENTPQDVLEKNWNEIAYLNEMGPDVIEYAEYVKEQYGIEVSYSNLGTNMETHKFDVSACCENNSIATDSLYYIAA
ncbi:tyrosine type site-specific recombinase [gut metagenome]|uniref:Tyrosine type site-specific recombinase n=1 Tax=gut metagenome TaxID=749906 RepID=J9FLW4_9ZZZZ